MKNRRTAFANSSNPTTRFAWAVSFFAAASISLAMLFAAPGAALAEDGSNGETGGVYIPAVDPEPEDTVSSLPQLSVTHVWALASKKGFNPSKGNYLPIRANFESTTDEYFKWGSPSTQSIDLVILNSKGKWVFQKKLDRYVYLDFGSTPIFYEWNGKASKGNTAGLKAGAYVKKTGTYKAQIRLTYKDNNTGRVTTASKSASFKISKKAKKGAAGYAQAKKLPVYTGDANTDYLVELMLKKAGVKSKDSQDKKVKKIYHYISKTFRVTNIGRKYKGSNRLTNLNSTTFKAGAAEYGKKMQAKAAKGTIMLSDGWGWADALNERAGICDYFAEAFRIMCMHVGVNASIHHGWYKNSSKDLMSHTWNSAVVNGKRYYYDADVEAINMGKGQGDYYWYKLTLKQSKKVHKYAK